MTDPYEVYCDYYENPTLICLFGNRRCSWSHEISWDDFTKYDGESMARRLFMEHYVEAHSEDTAADS